MYEKARGLKQGLLCENELSRRGVENWLNRVFGWYGDKMDCVDTQIIETQIIINKKTAPYLYSKFTPTKAKYKKGSRPELEKILKQILKPNMSTKEKFFAIMRRCRDNPNFTTVKVDFDGGTEEELLKTGKTMCNEISRAFCALTQVAGIPSRVVSIHITGHMMNEAYVDGKWVWCDCQKGNYAYLANGKLASWWELMQDPTIIDRQTKEVWKDTRLNFTTMLDEPKLRNMYLGILQEKIREIYLHPLEAAALGNYFVDDFHKYDYPYRGHAADPIRRELAVFSECQVRMEMNYPPTYWNYHCSQAKLRTVK